MKPCIYAGFRHSGHKSPTLKAVGSNPAGRTKENPVTKPVAGLFLFRVMVF